MTDATATNELLALADELIAQNYSHVRDLDAMGKHFDLLARAANALRAVAAPSAEEAEVSVEELASCLRKFVGWDGEMEAARALLGKYRMEKR